MVKIGVLSDSHLYQITDEYLRSCENAFAGCDAIIHAGDLTDISVLSPFQGKAVYAVSGNMCDYEVQQRLSKKNRFEIDGISFGVSHGAGSRHNIEDRVFAMFPDVNCIVYGHTHIPVCHMYGPVLMMNPGSFQATSRYGGPGSYGILTVENGTIKGKIHFLGESV